VSAVFFLILGSLLHSDSGRDFPFFAKELLIDLEIGLAGALHEDFLGALSLGLVQELGDGDEAVDGLGGLDDLLKGMAGRVAVGARISPVLGLTGAEQAAPHDWLNWEREPVGSPRQAP
jgi:hypothetical protein